ncbi:MAG TPA: hypothetical protein VE035_19630 [Puia sp.]|nr:hypothetical protein [Puia sp.]
MKIIGIDGMTTQQLNEEINDGAKFVIYRYCISIVVMSFRRSSDIYYIKPGQNGTVKGLPWTGLTFLLGWWGIPWGPIWSISCLGTNLQGGKDVTSEIVKSINIQELVS